MRMRASIQAPAKQIRPKRKPKTNSLSTKRLPSLSTCLQNQILPKRAVEIAKVFSRVTSKQEFERQVTGLLAKSLSKETGKPHVCSSVEDVSSKV
jgi:hypothetical protein